MNPYASHQAHGFDPNLPVDRTPPAFAAGTAAALRVDRLRAARRRRAGIGFALWFATLIAAGIVLTREGVDWDHWHTLATITAALAGWRTSHHLEAFEDNR